VKKKAMLLDFILYAWILRPRTIKFSNGQIIHRKEFCSLWKEEAK